MKLLRFECNGRLRPGLLDQSGTIRDLSAIISDIDFHAYPDLTEKLSSTRTEELPAITSISRFAEPISYVSKFIGIGLNYRAHAIESHLALPSEPALFMKATSCIIGPNDRIELPPNSTKSDWEVELGVVIGRRAKHIRAAEAINHVAGYVLVNDVSEREYQNERAGTWDKGKGYDTFGPIGPWLVTKDEIRDPQKLQLWLDVNNESMQRGNTCDMIFSCAEIVSYVSGFMTLHPGDIITTGTPAGVGMGRTPPVYLKPGDIVRLGIAGLGEQQHLVTTYGKL